VEWIGDIPAHWDVKPLKYELNFISEKFQSKQKKQLCYGMENIESWTGKFINGLTVVEGLVHKFHKNDILFGKLRPYLAKVALANSDGVCSTEFLVYRAKNDKLVSYYKYLLLSPSFIYLVDSATYGTKMPRASASFIGNQKLPIPAYIEQTAIANFLDCKTAKIDQAVAIKEEQIRLLKERKQILIQTAVTKGLDPNVPMADSGVEWIGQVPAHWTLKRLKFLFSSTGGGTPSKERKDYWQGNIPWVSPKDMKSDHITTTQDFVTEKGLRESSSNLIEIGSVLLVCRSGILQRKIPIAINKVPVCLNQDMKALTPISKILSEYFLYFVKGNNNFLRAECVKQGATVESIETELFENSFCVVPPLGEQKFIVSHIQTQSAKIDKAIDIQAQMIEKLKEYKATLINAAVTGKIKVPDPAESKIVA
jgi:type I restriction enzyme S subunit